MRILMTSVSAGAMLVFAVVSAAQAPAFKPVPVGNLKQVMRSILFPNSNVIFDVQEKLPKNDREWNTIENSCMAIAESASLIMLPNRLREDGKPVPSQQAAWIKHSQFLVSTGQVCLKVVKSRNQESISDFTNQLSDSCANCHDVYRDPFEKTGK